MARTLPFLLLSAIFALAQAPVLALDQAADIAPLLAKPSLSFETDYGWREYGSGGLGEYAIGLAKTDGIAEDEAATIAARPNATGRWNAGMTRNAPVEAWRGKRLRLSARFKTRDIQLLQMILRYTYPRRQGRTHTRTIAAPVIEGTVNWQRAEIVMDIPADAVALSYGFYIRTAKGIAFADSFSLEAVGKDVAPTRNRIAMYNPPNNAGCCESVTQWGSIFRIDPKTGTPIVNP